ncbi:MAG: 2,3-bisphosphoglycerate-independent phosphoglycerate mutase, partial [Parcubacteria group bacterium]|nr:2,3-bisphosphoglycerate-independent phosphoglycerate mutase [Parcubacteria group bacterium]
MSGKANNLPLALVILDGWGIAPPSRGNAITEARLPFYGELLKRYRTASLAAAGEAVGLPWGEPGNSEVGHLNL